MDGIWGADLKDTQVMSPKGARSSERRSRSLDARAELLPIEDGRVVEDRLVLPSIANGEQGDPEQFAGHLVPIPMTPMTKASITPSQTPLRPPQGYPQSFAPPSQAQPVTPLFNEEQLQRLTQLHQSAPHLYGLHREEVEPELPRPRFLDQEEVNVSNRQLQKQCLGLMDENVKLKKELEQIREGMFQTPSEDKKDKLLEEPPGLQGMSQETARRALYAESPLEMFTRMTSRPENAVPSAPASVPLLSRREGEPGPRPLLQDQGDQRGNGKVPVQDPLHGRKEDRQLDLMEKLIQVMIEDKMGGGIKGESSVESVKPGITTLVELPEVTTTAPIDLQDWLTAVEPAMGDLSDSSSLWWNTLLEEAQVWYLKYQQLPPLQRASFVPEPSESLKQSKWSRVEKRAVSLLLTALPVQVRQELVSSRSLTALKMITRLFTLYQPGGVQEKGVVLSS